jgi:hypothetical protein
VIRSRDFRFYLRCTMSTSLYGLFHQVMGVAQFPRYSLVYRHLPFIRYATTGPSILYSDSRRLALLSQRIQVNICGHLFEETFGLERQSQQSCVEVEFRKAGSESFGEAEKEANLQHEKTTSHPPSQTNSNVHLETYYKAQHTHYA